MNWKPVKRLADRARDIFHGELPPAAPPVTLGTALRDAYKADQLRHAMIQDSADLKAQIAYLGAKVMENDGQAIETEHRRDYIARALELIEARQMGGSGPWLTAELRKFAASADLPAKLRESSPITSQGAYGDIELALQNVEWRREINLSWLEFSRWGIQQIILISRLYYIKNPLIRRLIDIAACYVFGRDVEVSSPDEDANQVLKDFFEDNVKTLGQIALTNHERSKFTDGNLFFVFFPDTENTGKVKCRTIDATEIQDIVCNPNDSDETWYYRRCWTVRNFDVNTGSVTTATADRWYPDITYNPTNKPDTINGTDVSWTTPIHHRKCGAVAKWHFGCPLIYPALDWAREARRYLEACASVMQALSQIALRIVTKGGQQALQGVKLQMGTTVGPSTPLYDVNPPAIAGSTFASGPGTTIEAFKASGAAQDPERVRQYKPMCAMVVGVPESFLADMNTSNLATAQSLDRPTELVFLERQEAWREDLVIIAKYVLSVSMGAPNGRLREAMSARAINPDGIEFQEAARIRRANGRWMYVDEAVKGKKKNMGKPGTIEVKCTFPSIREGDIGALVTATATAMTLGNKGGEIVGIDEKAGVKLLFEYLGYEGGDELAEEMYPDKEYVADRTQEIEPPPIPTAPPISPGGQPQLKAGQPQPQPGEPPMKSEPAPPPIPEGKIQIQAHLRSKQKSKTVKEAMERLITAMELREAESGEEDEAEPVMAGKNGHGA